MSSFGELLRDLRLACRDPLNRKQLSQVRLGELLGLELLLKSGYSGAAVSDWEHDQSTIHKDDRFLLIALLKVLYKNGGLKTLLEAESLMAAGNYRALDADEKQRVFPKDLLNTSVEHALGGSMEKTTSVDPSSYALSIFDFRSVVSDAKGGAPPVWSLAVAALMRRISDRMEAWDFVRVLIWLSIWILAYILLTPALQWPFRSPEAAVDAVVIYIYASFALPLCIGILTNTKDNRVWKDRVEASSILVRLYTYQGAAVGFYVGYFAIFALHLVAYYLQLQFPKWFQFLLAGFPLFIGAVGANVVPDNLWRAFKRLSLRDGWIFFLILLVGPFWGWFFLQYYSWLISPIVGTGIIIIVLILAGWLTRRKLPSNSTDQ